MKPGMYRSGVLAFVGSLAAAIVIGLALWFLCIGAVVLFS